jgi:hypothetical protein
MRSKTEEADGRTRSELVTGRVTGRVASMGGAGGVDCFRALTRATTSSKAASFERVARRLAELAAASSARMRMRSVKRVGRVVGTEEVEEGSTRGWVLGSTGGLSG